MLQCTPPAGHNVDDVDELFTERTFASETRKIEIEAALAARHRGLAIKIARRYGGHATDIEDIEQVALLGLVKAIKRYEPSRAVPFAAFASPTISGEVKRYFRDCGWLVRPPRAIQERAVELAQVRSELEQRLGRVPSVGDFAQATGLSASAVDEALQSAHAMYGETLEDDVRHGLDPESWDARIDLRAAVARLTDHQRRVLHLRFESGWTQREIADLAGVSQMQVSRQIAGILRSLRESLDVESNSEGALTAILPPADEPREAAA
jgi:RNA polymerase sigma-B factor